MRAQGIGGWARCRGSRSPTTEAILIATSSSARQDMELLVKAGVYLPIDQAVPTIGITQRRSRDWLGRALTLIVLLSGGATIAIVLTHLQGQAIQSNKRARHAVDIVADVREIDSLEWRAIAGQDLAEISTQIDDLAAETQGELAADRTSPAAQNLTVAGAVYFAAIRDELAALRNGDLMLAAEIDEADVDPGFVSVIKIANDLAAANVAQANATERSVRWLTWVSTIGIVSLLGCLLLVVLAARGRHRDRQRDLQLSRRFRSLVEGSSDIVTVVSRVDSLSVMSPSLGPLDRSGNRTMPTTVSALLSPEVFNLWKPLDERLRAHGGNHQLETIVRRDDGSEVWLEGCGSSLLDSPDERVWIWRDITYRKTMELQLTHQAFHDALTGVANRSLLRDRTDHALSLSARSGAPISVLFCDLDDFKTVNDTLGHAHGDELLNIITKRIAACVRDGDTVARLGGDEFAILLEDADTNRAIALAERLLLAVAYEVTLADHTFFPSMSVGVVTAVPGTTTDELLRNADIAMYTAKRSGKGRSAVFQDRMHEITSELLQLQTDLKSAISAGQMSLHYQPTVALEGGAVEGVEALLRWEHPTLGSIPPDQFIPVAEATGMIIGIGRWVLRQACFDAVALGSGHPNQLLMHVNLSPQQLFDPTIVNEVKQALADSGLSPELLVLEITEGTLLDSRVAVERLHELHALGVLIAIDDFGTGYASISYLQQLPIQILKIDRSFISGSVMAADERVAFLHAIVGLAKSLQFHTVAEGIEDEVQLEELLGLGCDAGQGFLWAHATPLGVTRAAIEGIEAVAFNTLAVAHAR